MSRKNIWACFIALSLPAASFAFPLPKGPRTEMIPPSTYSTDYNFEGIVGLNNCSGSLIRFENSKDRDKAMVLTNGHCLEGGMPAPGEVVVNRESSRTFSVLDTRGHSIGRINAVRVLVSTMTKTDLTLYQLELSFTEILNQFHVHPLTLASHHPQTQQNIEIISGYWKMGFSCAMEAFVHELDEGGYAMYDSIRYSRPGCEVMGGTSGSPILAQGSRTVVGINNTGNEDGERCTMNNPCEIDEKGNVVAVKGYSYGQQTYWIYTCLNEQNEMDLKRDGCLLPH